MAKKKFDTNPLDPEFPKRATEARQSKTAPNFDSKTQPFSVTEEPTRPFDKRNFAPPFAPSSDTQNVPIAYQTSKLADMNSSSSRKVEKVGLPENVLTALPYIPFYVGLIAGILILLFVPKSEAKVRFHGAQGLAAHLAILLVTSILSGIGDITDLAGFGNAIFQVVTMIMLIIWAVKAWQGKPVHIESVDDLTEWLEDKINPRK